MMMVLDAAPSEGLEVCTIMWNSSRFLKQFNYIMHCRGRKTEILPVFLWETLILNFTIISTDTCWQTISVRFNSFYLYSNYIQQIISRHFKDLEIFSHLCSSKDLLWSVIDTVFPVLNNSSKKGRRRNKERRPRQSLREGVTTAYSADRYCAQHKWLRDGERIDEGQSGRMMKAEQYLSWHPLHSFVFWVSTPFSRCRSVIGCIPYWAQNSQLV